MNTFGFIIELIICICVSGVFGKPRSWYRLARGYHYGPYFDQREEWSPWYNRDPLRRFGDEYESMRDPRKQKDAEDYWRAFDALKQDGKGSFNTYVTLSWQVGQVASVTFLHVK